MSQFINAYLLTQAQLEHYASTYSGFSLPDESLELAGIPHDGDAKSIMALEAMMDEHIEDDTLLFTESPQIIDLHEKEVPILFAIHLSDVARVKKGLEDLGQDPYFNDGEAHGLAFSVQPGIKVPPTLVDIYKELEADLGVPRAKTGYLKRWAEQGVLLLNTTLTVRKGEANSHKGKGWEKFTDAVIGAVNAKPTLVVFVLWGANAQKKQGLIDASRHTIVMSVHPSPLAARGGFFGSRPFSKMNAALEGSEQTPMDWNLEPLL
ncbi:MAG: uracil-DNA glycosylase [Trueperaceae bacterium]